MKKVGNIINVILDILVVIIVIIFLIIIGSNIYMKITNKNSTMQIFNYSVYRISSPSMMTALNVGDLILIKEQESYELGDIVTFHTEEGIFTHRVVEVNGNLITTKGDANNANDEAIDISNIEGKMIRKLPITTWIYQKLSNKYISVPLMLLLVAIFVYANFKKEKD